MITMQKHQILEKDLTVKKKLDYKSTKYLFTAAINFGSSYPEIICDGVIPLGPSQ